MPPPRSKGPLIAAVLVLAGVGALAYLFRDVALHVWAAGFG